MNLQYIHILHVGAWSAAYGNHLISIKNHRQTNANQLLPRCTLEYINIKFEMDKNLKIRIGFKWYDLIG